MTLEQKARLTIDTLLQQAGWHVCNMADANIHAGNGWVIRDGRLLLGEVRYVDQPTYEFWSRRCPPELGDVLFELNVQRVERHCSLFLSKAFATTTKYP